MSRNTDDPHQRGAEDLPGTLREWVEMRPRWRVVEIGRYARWPIVVRLIDLDPSPAREHFQVSAPAESWEPEAMREAIFEAVYLFGLHYQTGHAAA